MKINLSTFDYYLTINQIDENKLIDEEKLSKKILKKLSKIANGNFLNYRDIDSIISDLEYCRISNATLNDFLEIADNFSKEYSLIIDDEEKRDIRMRLAKINYLIRKNDRSGCEKLSKLFSTKQEFIWDIAYLGHQRIHINSKGQGVTVADSRVLIKNAKLTQVEKISEKAWYIGGFYEDKGYEISSELIVKEIEYPYPVLLRFTYKSTLNIVVTYKDGIKIGNKTYRIDGKIHRCRVFKNCIYLISWEKYGIVYEMNLDNKNIRKITLQYICICNDIFIDRERIFAICKMQGHLFEYRSDFSYVNKIGNFSSGGNGLFDPISIKKNKKMIEVTSWFHSSVMGYRVL